MAIRYTVTEERPRKTRYMIGEPKLLEPNDITEKEGLKFTNQTTTSFWVAVYNVKVKPVKAPKQEQFNDPEAF